MALICSAAVLLPGLLNLQPERQHGLLFFSKESPEERQSLSGINASCKLGNHGCPGVPFPNTTQQIIAPCTRLFKSQKGYYVCGTPTNTATFGHSH